MKIEKFGIGLVWPDPGQNGTPCAILPRNGMFHCINIVQAVLWILRLTNSRLAQIIAPVNNIDSIKREYS